MWMRYIIFVVNQSLQRVAVADIIKI